MAASCVFPISNALRRAHHNPAEACALDNIVDYAQVDAFTVEAFKGNPAAVCVLPSPRDAKWMQNVAAEFNAPMTAFLVKRPICDDEGNCRDDSYQNGNSNGASALSSANLQMKLQKMPNEYDMRWFTPAAEVDLCGHATLASAYLLFTSALAAGSVILFHTRSGVLSARKAMRISGEEWQGKVELDFPIIPMMVSSLVVHSALSQTLSSSHVISSYTTTGGHWVLELQNEKEVEMLKVQTEELLSFDAWGLIVTAKSAANSRYDFVTRFFCPKVGIAEDYVCGSAHCALAPFWARKLGKQELLAYQASKRGGFLELRVDNDKGRVFLTGTAAIVTAGIILK